MDTEVGQAYHTVQLSTKEMLKNNRRQHYCNMIDLLASSCKASNLMDTGFSNEELVQFWLGDILPLMFDAEENIQTCTIAAMAEALVALDVNDIHSCSIWPQFKNDIISKYLPCLAEMRDAKNSNWHKVWTLLVQIMDGELLRGCTYINKFLAIVELGFRNSDNGVRSEAFLCWRVLIKLFAAYNELAGEKRLRLLLIPLRTSQSRSSHVSCIKLRVWWYLLTSLDTDLPKAFNNAVEYFLSLVYGGDTKANATGLAHTYQAARELALPCLASLWNTEPSEDLKRIMRELRLETLSQPSPLMQASVLEQHWRPLLAAAVVALNLMNTNNTTDLEQQLLHMLMRNLALTMFKLHIPEFIISCCTEFEKTLATDGRVVRALFNTCATENLVMQRGNSNDDLNVLDAYMKLCIKAKGEVPASVLQRCVTLFFSTEHLKARNHIEFRLLISFAELLMQSNDEEDYEAFAVKLHIWRQISTALVNYLRENALEYRLNKNSVVLDTWVLWPFHAYAGFAGRRVNTLFDNVFYEQWRLLLNTGHNAPERKKFVGDLKNALQELLNGSKEEPCFAEFFDAYVAAVLKLGICKNTPLYKDVFALLKAVFERPTLPQKTLEGCLNTLRNVILELPQNEITVIFDALKPTLSGALQCWSKQKYDGSFLKEWKRAILEKFRKLPLKSMNNQVKELFKSDDLFVIIPSVWSLNPDKLTDRQKERFAEKSDIPALYNDMSQSQDSSSIKPWTPNKVVIAKSKQSELAIGGGVQESIQPSIEIDDSSNDSDPRGPIFAETPQTPSTKRQSVECTKETSTEQYNFRKPRAPTVDEVTKPVTIKVETPVRVTRQRSGTTQKDSSAEKQETTERQLRSPSKQQDQTIVKTPTQKGKTSERRALEDTKSATQPSEDLTVAASLESAELQKQTSIPPETQLIEPQEMMVDPAQAATEARMEAKQMQESSPKKINTRLCNLNSPPDRKQTNNSTSPTLRPKPTAHLTGRGAQLINMIRNKKLDAVSPYARLQATPVQNIERAEMVSTPISEINELTGTDQTSTPIQPKELLIFSKRLPSPSASPSASILKRKLRSESIEDFSMESPAFKRKRVSFHDPPVSVTKEYLRDVDDSRSKPKRCLLLDKIVQTPEMKNALKRRGRLDSIIEIERFAKEQTARTASVDKSMDKSSDVMEDEAFTTLKWNDTHNAGVADISNVEENADLLTIAVVEPEHMQVSRDLAIMDADTALELVLEQCPLENVLERYFDKPHSTSLKQANTLAKFLSTKMGTNDKLKTSVLETLSENHSKDFLDHAVRENLSSVVCDRLNPNAVLDYICAKSKINSCCRSNLLTQVPDILKSSRVESERLEFVQQLVAQCGFNDEQLLDVITHLMRTRETRERNTLDLVSEIAADSSSNL